MTVIKKMVLDGNAFPTENVIKFGVEGIDNLIRKSNAGLVMDEVVKSSMFKSEELDLAWKHVKGISKIKQVSERFVDEVTLLKVLGISPNAMRENHDTAFLIGREKYLADNEKAALLYDALSAEESFLTNKLEYQLGFKNGNKKVISDIVDRLDSVSMARSHIESVRKFNELRRISDGKGADTHVQEKYKKSFKKPGAIFNTTDKTKVVYKITGKLYDKEGNPNWNAIKFQESIRPGGKSRKLMGDFIVLNNPIVAHRISREPTIEGYTWHFVHNNTPMFVDQLLFKRYRFYSRGANK